MPNFKSDEADTDHVYHVREADIDGNGHVEATVYVHWILDHADVEPESSLHSLDIEYKQECFLGQEVHSLSKRAVPVEGSGSERVLNHIVQTKEGELLLKAESHWKDS